MIHEVFFAPHPPLAVHAIGQGNERRIQATLDGYEKIAKDIESSRPDTVIYLSPHGNAFRDAFAVIQADEVSGDFAPFGYGQVGVTKKVNSALTDAIINGFNSAGIPVAPLNVDTAQQYKVNITLDHGVLVPMHFIDGHYKDYQIVHISTGFMTPQEHYLAGEKLQSIVSSYDGSVVVVASGDLSHALKEEGPYSYNAFGKEFDRKVQKAIASKDCGPLLSLTTSEIEAAAQCGLGSFCMGFGIMEGKAYSGEVYSYEGPFGVGYLTGKLSSQ